MAKLTSLTKDVMVSILRWHLIPVIIVCVYIKISFKCCAPKVPLSCVYYCWMCGNSSSKDWVWLYWWVLVILCIHSICWIYRYYRCGEKQYSWLADLLSICPSLLIYIYWALPSDLYVHVVTCMCIFNMLIILIFWVLWCTVDFIIDQMLLKQVCILQTISYLHIHYWAVVCIINIHCHIYIN